MEIEFLLSGVAGHPDRVVVQPEGVIATLQVVLVGEHRGRLEISPWSSISMPYTPLKV